MAGESNIGRRRAAAGEDGRPEHHERRREVGAAFGEILLGGLAVPRQPTAERVRAKRPAAADGIRS